MAEANRQAALVTLEQVSVKVAFDKYSDQIIAALDSRVVDEERFMRTALTVIRRNPQLEKCSLASILGAFVQCGQLGLYPDDLRGYVYLIPYYVTKRDGDQVIGRVFEADLMVGYQGWVELFRQSGYAAMNAVEGRIVHHEDDFRYAYRMKDGRRADEYEHIPSGAQDPGEESHYYALLNYKDGTSALHVMSKAQAEAHRDEYAKTKKKQGPWFHPMQFGEMAIKTAIRKITKYAPSSPNMRTAAALEELSEAGIDQRLGALLEINERAMAPVIEMPSSSANRGRSTSKMAQFMDAAAPAPATQAKPKEEPKKKGDPEGTIRDDHGNLVDASTGEILEEVNTGEAEEKKAEPKKKDKPKAQEKKDKPKPKPEPEPEEVEDGELSEEEAAKLENGKGEPKKGEDETESLFPDEAES